MAQSSDKTTRSKPRRGPGRPWPKGVSGNPGGLTLAQARARKKTQDILFANGEEFARALVEAAKAANATAIVHGLDRVLGKMPQAVEHSGPDGGPIEMTGDEARELLTERIARIAASREAGEDHRKP